MAVSGFVECHPGAPRASFSAMNGKLGQQTRITGEIFCYSKRAFTLPQRAAGIA